MRIYLAADYARKHEMQGCRDLIEDLGHKVTSRWIDTPDAVEDVGIGSRQITDDTALGFSVFAETDYEDIQGADTLILFTTGELTRGGRHTEFGIALGLRKGLIVIGPREHVFHCPTRVTHWPTWRAFVIDFSRGGNS